MNFNELQSKAPPVIKKRNILVPVGPLVASARPNGITKQNRPRILPTPIALQQAAADWYRETPPHPHSLANHAREHGASLSEIERFDTTGLWGAREYLALERIHANHYLLASPPPLTPPRREAFPPPYKSDVDAGDEDIFLPSPRAGPPRLMVTLPVPAAIPPTNTTTAPRRKAANRPPAPPGPPTHAVYAVGTQDIPAAVQAVVEEIQARAARKSNKAGFPQRVDLRNLPSGMMDLDRRYGYIARGSGLMEFYGDLRMFDEATWRYLVSSGKGD